MPAIQLTLKLKLLTIVFIKFLEFLGRGVAFKQARRFLVVCGKKAHYYLNPQPNSGKDYPDAIVFARA